MSQEPIYTGEWITLKAFLDSGRELEVGHLVMCDTLDGVLVDSIAKVDEEGILWHSNRYIIPINQILAVQANPHVDLPECSICGSIEDLGLCQSCDELVCSTCAVPMTSTKCIDFTLCPGCDRASEE
jgi:hypothetical protein